MQILLSSVLPVKVFLPVTINQDYTIEIADDVETELKVINGSYEITDSMVVQEHTLLIVNGALNIHSGTKEILEKYEKIHVNGSVRCAESISGSDKIIRK